MKKIKLFFVLFICLSFIYSKCEKEYCKSILVPHTPYFQIKKNGIALADSIKSQIKSFYFIGGQKYYCQKLSMTNFSSYGYSDGLVLKATEYIDGPKGNEPYIRDFYLENPNGKIDSIYLEFEHVSCDDGLKDVCQCVYPIKTLTFNGKSAFRDTSVKWEIIWILNK